MWLELGCIAVYLLPFMIIGATSCFDPERGNNMLNSYNNYLNKTTPTIQQIVNEQSKSHERHQQSQKIFYDHMFRPRPHF
jgi:hypothetical protein